MERPIVPMPKMLRRGRLGTALTGTLLAALVALSALTGLSSTTSARQPVVPPTAGITVIGYGAASAPAQSAELQMIVSRADYGPPMAPDADATPGAEQRELVASTVDALIAAGVVKDDIKLIVSSAFSGVYGPGGSTVARVDVTILDPTIERISELVDAATLGAAQERLVLGQIGVGYETADCAPLQRQAREAALADAQALGDLQAELVGVGLGEVVGTTDIPVNAAESLASYYGGFAPTTSACAPPAPTPATGATVSVPPYDPAADATVTVFAQISVTYEITRETMATPAS